MIVELLVEEQVGTRKFFYPGAERSIRTDLSSRLLSSLDVRPDLLHDREQKCRCQPEQNQPIQRFHGSHELPLRMQINIRVAVCCHRAERIEHGQFSVGHRSNHLERKPPDGCFYPVQHCYSKHRDTHHQHGYKLRHAMLTGVAQDACDVAIYQPEADGMKLYGREN
jgi:hypothetical protein